MLKQTLGEVEVVLPAALATRFCQVDALNISLDSRHIAHALSCSVERTAPGVLPSAQVNKHVIGVCSRGCSTSFHHLLVSCAHGNAVQDSDRFWRVTPPARRSIQRMLNSSAATLALSWEVLRNAPLATKNGGPLCQGVQEVPLSAASSQDILDVLQVAPTRSMGNQHNSTSPARPCPSLSPHVTPRLCFRGS